MKYNKLIRDKIPEIIEKKGDVAVTHVASDEEYWKKLKEKLSEEVDEFLNEDNKEELVDVLEVIDAICYFKGLSKEELDVIKKEKQEKRGGFKDRIILDEVKD